MPTRSPTNPCLMILHPCNSLLDDPASLQLNHWSVQALSRKKIENVAAPRRGIPHSHPAALPTRAGLRWHPSARCDHLPNPVSGWGRLRKRDALLSSFALVSASTGHASGQLRRLSRVSGESTQCIMFRCPGAHGMRSRVSESERLRECLDAHAHTQTKRAGVRVGGGSDARMPGERSGGGREGGREGARWHFPVPTKIIHVCWLHERDGVSILELRDQSE